MQLGLIKLRKLAPRKQQIFKLHLFTELLHTRQRFGCHCFENKMVQIFAAWYALTEVFLNLKHQIRLS